MTEANIVYRSTLNGQRAELELVDRGALCYRLIVDGISQSQVCLTDPTQIEFDYARYIARVLDGMTHGPESAPVVVHLGGGALTLARYVAATRPQAVQYVVESEAERTTDLLGILPLPTGSDVRFLFDDARAVVDGGPAGATHAPARPGSPPWGPAQATIVDLWAGSSIARRVASLQFYSEVSRLMTADGFFVANLIDGPGFAWSRRQAATIATLFEHVAIVMDTRMLSDQLIGNVLVFGSNVPMELLGEPGWPAGDRNPPAVLLHERATAWIGDATPVDDSEATDSPPPRADYFAEFSKGSGGLVGTLGDAVRREN